MGRQLLFYIFFVSFIGNSQISDDFSDGDFTLNPTWIGTSTDFIVNANEELQLNGTTSATSYLSTPHALASLDDKEWRFRVKQSFTSSSSNYSKVYLCANSADPNTNPDGFYLLLGEALSVDAVKLYKQEGGVSTLICAGPSGSISTSFDYGIKVTRDATGLWTISTDPTGGTNFVFESSGTDATNLVGTSFIWQCTYTSSNSTKFYLDDFYVGNIPVDISAPKLLSATAIDASSVDVLFNEPLDPTVAQLASNYEIQPFLSATSAVLDALDPKLVHLTVISPLTNGSQYNLIVNLAEDLSGNDTTNQSVLFTYFVPETPSLGDVIITEIFADPSPTFGLPELEFVEIYNRSTKFFDLDGWKLGDASTDGTIQSGLLAPGDYRVLCATSSVPSFVNSIAVSSFPGLNNASDDVVLKDSNGFEIDLVSYTDDWYKDAVKKNGGYSLELINPTLICSSSQNWIASTNPIGGTPGTQNSVFDDSPDVVPPSVTLAYALAPNKLTLQFSEPMDAIALQASNLVVQPALTESNRIINGAEPTEMSIFFAPNFVPSTTYTYTLNNAEDCAGNVSTITGSFILADYPTIGEVVINEILADPVTGGVDYVEIYNTSAKVFDLYEWKLANLDGDTVANEKQILVHFILHPGEYAVITKDTSNVILNYPNHGTGRFIQSDLPTYANEGGTVVLMTNFDLLDQVSYSDDWHFKLLDSEDGKSLERINALDGSNDPNNWHTAAESIGFGTPGLENSQYVPFSSSGDFSLPNKVFSPDNDGHEDVLQMRYNMSENGMLANVSIFDDLGRLVRELTKNEVLGTDGVLVWDGVNDNGTKATIGQYIVVFEAFNSNTGTKFASRKVCVLAGKL